MDTDSGRIGKPNGLSSQAIEPASRLDPDGLLSLARRCEEAAGPEYALERDIHAALGPAQRAIPLNYSASIDAAMMLVPEGCDWALEIWGRPRGIYTSNKPSAWVEGAERAFAATPALAFCAAALRARAAIAMETQSAMTEGHGPKDDSAGRQASPMI
ncbi:hypothetical protein SH584_11585 [Sphingomonas sp. LY29]|uniref:hypothetical protein n=1 Tax=Sphingomonas sp. LY29 TaxID=3095341 RepID=UPI002D7A0E51|nr:hypothetical protein [Sphingomonas sp. LY29]WRP25673.1 hypothetical protein SH584_11585 [Sphingomonas sp. LY29]